jgi:hypothetical protein
MLPETMKLPAAVITGASRQFALQPAVRRSAYSANPNRRSMFLGLPTCTAKKPRTARARPQRIVETNPAFLQRPVAARPSHPRSSSTRSPSLPLRMHARSMPTAPLLIVIDDSPYAETWATLADRSSSSGNLKRCASDRSKTRYRSVGLFCLDVCFRRLRCFHL